MGAERAQEVPDAERAAAETRQDSPDHDLEHRKSSAVTTQSTSPVLATPEKPAGIPRIAWLKTLGCFILFFNTWGIILAFGAFQTYYEQDLLRHKSSSSISWIGTISAFLLLLGGATSGKVYDLGFSRYLLVIGSFLVVFGLMMTSLATQYYQVLLAQGIAVGIGTSLLWIPAMTIVAGAFQAKMRAIMIGVVSAGTSIGGVIYPIMFRCLQPQIGFPWTVRTMAFLELGLFLIALAVLLPITPAKSPKARRIIDKTALTDIHYMVFMTSGLFTMLGYFAPLVYIPTFVETSVHNLSRSDLGFYTLAVANGSSSISRITGGFIAAKFGASLTYTVSLFISAILLLAWIAIHSIAGVMVWAVLFGFSTGLIMSLPGAIIPQLCPSLELLGTRIGMSFFGASVGILIGGPIGGKLIFSISSTYPTWWPLQVFTGLAMFIGASLNVYVWIHIMRKQRAQQASKA